MDRRPRWRPVLLVLFAACGASEASPPPTTAASVGTEAPTGPTDGFTELEPGVHWRRDGVQRDGGKTVVWLYRPAETSGPLPLVVIAPAGSTLVTGMDLGDGDRAEHLPYVREGILVVSYSLSGAVAQDASDTEFDAASREFMQSEAGLVDMKTALDHALSELPVDPDRVFMAGHSSAATHALLAAALEPRIQVVAAFAPVVDIVAHFRRLGVDDTFFAYTVSRISPVTHVRDVLQPSLLFAAADDRGISLDELRAFHAGLPPGAERQLVIVPTGGHYPSMLQDGIPAAIRFFRDPAVLSHRSPSPAERAEALCTGSARVFESATNEPSAAVYDYWARMGLTDAQRQTACALAGANTPSQPILLRPRNYLAGQPTHAPCPFADLLEERGTRLESEGDGYQYLCGD